eukprot:gnl/MRDRNA2_/MRDRNA2_106125_c0_seq1.p1 gnl/MRDRNA2_/MRDRNA2_106125_c0~~gnl/MRDRNA2_/MRDRNA2_106125_c0_seq1.p1  ORF type:complete len:469 (+),score=106.69 gnl/MRDRNA2_/MRDRNA2_106125_c0_seq1:62-1408(+)
MSSPTGTNGGGLFGLWQKPVSEPRDETNGNGGFLGGLFGNAEEEEKRSEQPNAWQSLFAGQEPTSPDDKESQEKSGFFSGIFQETPSTPGPSCSEAQGEEKKPKHTDGGFNLFLKDLFTGNPNASSDDDKKQDRYYDPTAEEIEYQIQQAEMASHSESVGADWQNSLTSFWNGIVGHDKEAAETIERAREAVALVEKTLDAAMSEKDLDIQGRTKIKREVDDALSKASQTLDSLKVDGELREQRRALYRTIDGLELQAAWLVQTSTSTDSVANAESGKGAEPVVESSGTQTLPVSAFDAVDVATDGRCLFRSLALGTELVQDREADEEDAADYMRLKVVEALKNERAEFEHFLEIPWDRYIVQIADKGTWGGEPELCIAAKKVLKRPLWCWMPGETVDRGKYSGQYILLQQYPDDKFGMGTKEQAVHLRFNGRNHYDLLLLNTDHSEQ